MLDGVTILKMVEPELTNDAKSNIIFGILGIAIMVIGSVISLILSYRAKDTSAFIMSIAMAMVTIIGTVIACVGIVNTETSGDRTPIQFYMYVSPDVDKEKFDSMYEVVDRKCNLYLVEVKPESEWIKED